jgi:predicted PurR-regulated permease PerM
MEPKKASFVMYSALFIILIILAFWVVKPFILSILAGIIIAYIFYPVYRWLLRRIKSKGWSAFIVAILIILIFTVPFFFIVQSFAKDAYVSYVLIKQKISASMFAMPQCTDNSFSCSAMTWFQNLMSSPQAKFYAEDALSKITQWAMDKTNEIVMKIPVILLQILVTMFVIYYSLKDGDKFIKKVIAALPLKRQHYTTIMEKTKEMINSTIYGFIVVAAIQGTLAGLGFFIFGVKSPVLLGMLAALAALLPVVGTAIVWGPVVAVYFLDALLSSNSLGMVMALGLLAYSLFPVSTIDNFIRPKIIGDKAKVHPILILLGILGGFAAFGIVGVLVGPIIITLFVIFIDIYQEERLDHEAGS